MTDRVSTNMERYILYSGNVSKRYGIADFVTDFLKANIPINFYICGEGDFSDELQEISKKEDKIEYLGLLDKPTVFKLQRRASLLVNPRSYNDEYTKYSFPSKTMEYLLSGTPVMMERLLGIPDEYYQYIIEVPINGWCDALKNFCARTEDENRELGNAGRRFVLESKGIITQGRKIVNFIFNGSEGDK